jgi:predicted SAM-dependent methyltransferase
MIQLVSRILEHLKYLLSKFIYGTVVFITFKLSVLFEPSLKIIIGASETHFPGWVVTEQFFFDVTKAESWKRNFGTRKIDNLLAEHVFEHLTVSEIICAIKHASKYLKPGGIFRIAVPDGYHPSAYMRELVKPGGLEEAAKDHKVLLNVDLMRKLVNSSHFSFVAVEYFGKNGHFVSEYTDDNGYIFRSSKNYVGRFTASDAERKKLINAVPVKTRNAFKKLNVTTTSLIVDLIKK